VDTFPAAAPDGEWVSVFRSSSRRPCEEQALVLKAMNIEHRVSERPDACHVLVPAAQAAFAGEQLRLYQRENPRRPVTPWPAIEPARGLGGALGFALLLSAAYMVQSGYAWGIDWTDAGELIAGQVRAGQWWRAVTALTLHGDAAHVSGNLVFGSFFGYLAGQYLGSGVAWLAALWAAVAGNIANAFMQSSDHRSIGASTAVFAALGIVASVVWIISRRFTLGWARRWAPVVGAVALLAYIGTGDEQTDITAHLTGFVAGAAAGVAFYRLADRGGRGRLLQGLCAAAALVTIAVAWTLALLRP
jgi:membrane associated rhomboid family serine protease